MKKIICKYFLCILCMLICIPILTYDIKANIEYCYNIDEGINLYYKLNNNKIIITDYEDNEKHYQVSIPSEIDGYKVVEIADFAFSGSSIKSIKLPNTLKTIGEGCFKYCFYLEEIKIPYGVESVGENSFNSCSRLKFVLIPDSITVIEHGLFSECDALSSIILPDSIVRIEDYAFYKCRSLKDVILPEGIKSINRYTFSECWNLEKIKFSNNLINISEGAFSGCRKLKNIELPRSLYTIGDYAFNQCVELSEIIIPSSVTSIGCYAFRKCKKIEKTVISSGVKEIGRYAFSECENLEEVIIHNGLKMIEAYAFNKCNSIKKLVLPKSIKNIKTPKSNFVGEIEVYGYKNSYAEEYASEREFKFSEISSYINISDIKPRIEVEETNYSSVSLKWDKIDGVEKYKVYYSSKKESGYNLFSTYDSQTTQSTITKLDTGKTYYFKIKGINNLYGENEETKYSNVICAKTKLSAPKNLYVAKNTYNSVKVMWDKVSGATYYEVWRKIGDKGSWKKIKTYTKDIQKVKVSSIETGTKYYFKVRAKRYSGDDAIYSSYSNTDYATPELKKPTITVTKKSSTSVNVSWKTIDGANGYQLYYATGSDSYKKIYTATSKQKNVLVHSLTKGITYGYKLRAYRNVSGKKVYSKFSTIVTMKL